MANKHISYRQFKNIFGDLGLTAWVKYNWLSNGLPDGEYNGITKVTFEDISDWSFVSDTRQIAYLRNSFIIPPSSQAETWAYGFSNYKIITRSEMDNAVNVPSIAIDGGTNVQDRGAICVKIPNCDTKAKVAAYLKDHPIILYYYNRNVWGGEIVNSVTAGQENLYYVSSDITNRAIRDVKGDFESVSPMTSSELHDSPLDLVVCNNPSNRSIYFKDDSIGLNATEFNAKYCPRAIVYKLLPDPL